MKCPICYSKNINPSKKEGYSLCKGCGAVIRDVIKDDENLTFYSYRIKTMRTKEADPFKLWSIFDSKYHTDTTEVVAYNDDQQAGYSFFFGYTFIVAVRKKK